MVKQGIYLVICDIRPQIYVFLMYAEWIGMSQGQEKFYCVQCISSHVVISLQCISSHVAISLHLLGKSNVSLSYLLFMSHVILEFRICIFKITNRLGLLELFDGENKE